MSNILSIVGTVAFVIAGVAAVAGIYFWFSYQIPKVIDDLTGRSAKKSIEALREQNEKTGVKSYRPSKTNIGRGKLTEKMKSEKLGSGKRKAPKIAKKAQPVSEDVRPDTGVLKENRIGVAYEDETARLLDTDADGSEETALLTKTEDMGAMMPVQRRTKGVKLTMIDEEMLVHSDEEI